MGLPEALCRSPGGHLGPTCGDLCQGPYLRLQLLACCPSLTLCKHSCTLTHTHALSCTLAPAQTHACTLSHTQTHMERTYASTAPRSLQLAPLATLSPSSTPVLLLPLLGVPLSTRQSPTPPTGLSDRSTRESLLSDDRQSQALLLWDTPQPGSRQLLPWSGPQPLLSPKDSCLGLR